MNDAELIRKYNVPGPRYTSYPTVPFWKNDKLDSKEWVKTCFDFIQSKENKGVSVYIHLPFCESLCTFCGCHKRITKNHSVEVPYIDSLLAEWELYKNALGFSPRIQELHLGGGTPTFFAPAEIIRLMEGLFSAKSVNPESCELSFEAHPGSTSEEHLQVLYNFGFRRVSFGIQDYDAQVQQAIHRIQSYDLVKNVHDLAKKIGYTSVNHDLVYGLPKQHFKAFESTIEKTIELRPERIALYSYAHVPWIKGVGQRGYDESDLPQDSEKRALYEMGYEKLVAAGYVSIGMDHFALPEDGLSQAFFKKNLHRNFMGYTTQSTAWMIGLGMSAISDCWTGFAQNEKTVEAYQQRVAQGEIPVFRGHLLTEEELVIRRYILDLMCHFATSFVEDKRLNAIHEGIKNRLQPLIADGMLTVSQNRVEVSSVGMPFVRNICMAFDLDLANKTLSQPTFSKTI